MNELYRYRFASCEDRPRDRAGDGRDLAQGKLADLHPIDQNNQSLDLQFVFPDKRAKLDQQAICAGFRGLRQFQFTLAAQRPGMPRLGLAPS
jgi:hypothetical protein